MNVYEVLEKNSVYIVLAIVSISWFVIFGFLWKLDKKVKKIEQEK